MNELMDEYGPSSGDSSDNSDDDDELGGPDFNDMNLDYQNRQQQQYDYENPIEAHQRGRCASNITSSTQNTTEDDNENSMKNRIKLLKENKVHKQEEKEDGPTEINIREAII